jgi:hypothetical protein
MQTNLVLSDRIVEVGYEQRTRHLRVEFRDGAVREYAGVDIALYHQVLQPHPWRRVGKQLEALPHEQLQAADGSGPAGDAPRHRSPRRR